MSLRVAERLSNSKEMIYGEGNLIGYPTEVRTAPDILPGCDAALDIYDHSTGGGIYVMAAVYHARHPERLRPCRSRAFPSCVT